MSLNPAAFNVRGKVCGGFRRAAMAAYKLRLSSICKIKDIAG